MSAVRRPQMTSKCGKNISDTLACGLCATSLFLRHFNVICDLLLNRRTATWNLFVKWTTLFFLFFRPEMECTSRRIKEQYNVLFLILNEVGEVLIRLISFTNQMQLLLTQKRKFIFSLKKRSWEQEFFFSTRGEILYLGAAT